jgi:predicted Zn-dependent protease
MPDSQRLNLQRGIVYAMMGQFPEARAAFEVAPDHPLTGISLGLVLMQMDKVPEAIDVLRRRSKAGGGYLVDWFFAEALNRAGVDPESPQEAEAIAALQRSVARNPDLAQSRVLLGKMLFRKGDLEGALAHLQRALMLEPENTAATYQLAQVYSRKGDGQRAKELFAKVSKAKAEDREQFTTRGLQQIVREGTQ